MMRETVDLPTSARRRRAAITVTLSILFACAASAADVWAVEPMLGPPSNDDCIGAIPIPSSSLPYLTAPVNLLEATAVGEPALCSTSDSTVWYTFTPTETAAYEFTTCPEVSPANNLYSTVLSVLTAASCAGPFTATQCTYRDALCGEEFWQPRVTVSLTAGTVYYIVAGGIAKPFAGKETLQIHVARAAPPPNGTCDSPTPVTLDVPTPGAFALARNDYNLPTSACYSLPSGPPAPVGQTYSSAPGRDVVYSFTPDTTGAYSFRVDPFGIDCCSNIVLYASTTCLSPAGACIGAANRDTGGANWYGAEEIVCLPLLGGQTYFAYVDETFAYLNPIQFRFTVSRCVREVEPNDTPSTAENAQSGVEGATGTANDFDYFSLGSPPAGARVFAMADQAAGNTWAIRMRITDATNTLEFDNDDNGVPWGVSSPNIAGRALEGSPSYIQISPDSTTTVSEPYRLTYVLQPPGAGFGGSSATPESESSTPPNHNAAGNMFFSGEIFPAGDVDRFTFCAHAGDEMFASLDSDPLRDNTPFDGSLTFWNTHGIGIGWSKANSASDNTPGTGSLTGLTPYSPADALTWRASETGRYRVNVNSFATGSAATGDYLLSIAVNGQIGAAQSVDLAVASSGPPDPVPTGALLTYTVTVTNSGPNIAQVATVTDPLPIGTTFDSLEQSGPGGNWTCTLPAVGTNGTIRCENACFEDGGSHTFTLRARLDHCLGNGVVLTNTASIVSLTAELNGGNNAAAATTTVVDGGSCDDGNACTTSDVCNGSVCQGSVLLSCDDANACTTDSCDAILGCQNVPIPLPAAVDDSLRVAKAGADAQVSWSDPPGPFNIYRGTRSGGDPWSYNHACVAPQTEGPYTDPTTPPEQTLFYYLVSRENACGQESEVGHDSQGTPNPNPNSCRCVGVVCGATPSCLEASVCVAGVCTYYPVAPDGTSCNDGDCLTLNDRCGGGICSGAPSTPVDTDGDGVVDTCDPCPVDYFNDSDYDGVCNSADFCWLDPLKVEPGICGCGSMDIDSDLDGVLDCFDPCPSDNPDDANGDGCCDSWQFCDPSHGGG